MQTLLNTPYIAFTIAIYIIFLFVKESQAVQNGPYLSIFGFFKKRPKIPELLAFHSNSEFSKLMLPIIDKVSKDTGLHIEVIQVDDHKNYELFSSAMNFCGEGGLPLYLNVSTGEYILGITTYENLKLLALGKKPERYSRINVNLLEDASYRTTGLIGRIKRFIREVPTLIIPSSTHLSVNGPAHI
uniref:Uncharacterized protein n=1 Tax=Theileria parva TaxID=5875 RepID=Q4N3E7_THEPA|eukprot:XP_763675.1 hypothetical protein [Theileria parva strain Muguga]